MQLTYVPIRHRFTSDKPCFNPIWKTSSPLHVVGAQVREWLRLHNATYFLTTARHQVSGILRSRRSDSGRYGRLMIHTRISQFFGDASYHATCRIRVVAGRCEPVDGAVASLFSGILLSPAKYIGNLKNLKLAKDACLAAATVCNTWLNVSKDILPHCGQEDAPELIY